MTTDEFQEEFWTGGESFIIGVDTGVDTDSTTKHVIINKNYKIVKKKSEGCICIKCGDLYEYAEPNREDGTFKCWGCRH